MGFRDRKTKGRTRMSETTKLLTSPDEQKGDSQDQVFWMSLKGKFRNVQDVKNGKYSARSRKNLSQVLDVSHVDKAGPIFACDDGTTSETRANKQTRILN